MNALEVLTKARELILDPEKWTSHGFGSEAQHGICSALSAAKGGNRLSGAYRGKGYDILSELCAKKGFGRDNVSGFSADPKTTHDDVLALFGEAIAIALNKENK